MKSPGWGKGKARMAEEKVLFIYISYHNASCLPTIYKPLTFENERIVCWEELIFNSLELSVVCITTELTSWVKSASAAVGIVYVAMIWFWTLVTVRCESWVYGQPVLLTMVLAARWTVCPHLLPHLFLRTVSHKLLLFFIEGNWGLETQASSDGHWCLDVEPHWKAMGKDRVLVEDTLCSSQISSPSDSLLLRPKEMAMWHILRMRSPGP